MGMSDDPLVRALSGSDFMRQHHQRELESGGVRNPDGSISTYYGMTAPDESGRNRMLPTIWGGQALSPPDAYARARAQGLWRYPGSFSPTRTLHNYMNDPNQHPHMEQDLQDYLLRNALAGDK
jgi:hypothetical protein